MNRWILFLISVLVLGAAWWTSEFPMLAFVALAPAIALFMPAPSQSSENGEDLSDPGQAERILLLFGIVFIGSSFLTKGGHFEAAVWSIAYTLPFLVLAWVRHNLGSRAGVVPLILAWMTMEYLVVKVQGILQVLIQQLMLGLNMFKMVERLAMSLMSTKTQ